MGRVKTGPSDIVNKIFPHLQKVQKVLKSGYEIAKKTGVDKKIKKAILGSEATKHKNDYKNDDYAHLSSLAYEKDASKKIKASRKLGYDVDSELSTDNHTVFKHRKSGKAVISYRGTDPSNFDDLAADADIFAGKRDHKRFRDALQVAKAAQKKYPQLETTGHSLGGTQALHVYNALGVKARVYNPGGRGVGSEELKKHGTAAEIIRHESDIVSNSWKTSATETYADEDLLGKIVNGDVYGTGQHLLAAHGIPGQPITA